MCIVKMFRQVLIDKSNENRSRYSTGTVGTVGTRKGPGDSADSGLGGYVVTMAPGGRSSEGRRGGGQGDGGCNIIYNN